MNEIVLVKTTDGVFLPATSHDAEESKKYRPGQAIRISPVQIKDRSLSHHRLYFGGLLALAMDYWEPKGGLVSNAEETVLRSFSEWLDKKSGRTGALGSACDVFLRELELSRGSRIESPHKSKEGLHAWVKVKAGYYNLVQTPTGIRKEPKSINFNAMDQDAFNEFYRAAFAVVWRFILCQCFDDEGQAQNAINQLASMG